MDRWSLIVAANNQAVLSSTLLKSPAIDHRCQVIVKRGFSSAGKAYNSGILDAGTDVLVFAHQDVFLPLEWRARMADALKMLAGEDTRWGVLGSFGITTTGEARGYVYSTGLKRTLGNPFDGLLEAQSLDELVLVVRRSSGLTFDNDLPHFHLYGADVCQEALALGLKSYIVPAFCVHNSNGIKQLPAAFWRSYLYMRRKWWRELPIKTCCTTVTRFAWPMAKSILSDFSRPLRFPPPVGRRVDDVTLLYRRIQCERATANRWNQPMSELAGPGV